jgi:hypothetical protein
VAEDLIDRSIIIELEKIDQEDRKDERTAKQATMNSEMIKQRKEEKEEPIDFENKEVNNEIFEL